MFNKNVDPYENVIDFIGAAIDATVIREMLIELEKLPDNIRRNTITKFVADMYRDNESIEFIQIMEMMKDRKVLHAMNSVIDDIQKTKSRSINAETLSSSNFTVLIGLIAAF